MHDSNVYIRNDVANMPDHGIHIHGRYIECVRIPSDFIAWCIEDLDWVKFELHYEPNLVIRRTLIFEKSSYISLFLLRFSQTLLSYMSGEYERVYDPVTFDAIYRRYPT